MDAPDTSAFWRDDNKGKFEVYVDVRGTWRETVSAESEAEARAKIEASLENNEIELFSDDIDDARITSVRPYPTMYLITRDGQAMASSRVLPGDEPREPISTYEASYVRPTGGA